MKFFILILLIISLLIVPVFVFAECNKVGTTVIFVNGIFGDLKFAQADAKSLAAEYSLKGAGRDVSFLIGYNASHGDGGADLVEAGVQMYLGGYLDHDLTDILRQVYVDLKTQKILLVGHSQGTFYTNAAYDYLIGHGVDKSSIAVYNVATPANKVAGGGNYLTSSTDEIINSIARKLATLVGAKKPLPANIDIKIPNDPEVDYRNGHSFSNVYLGLVPDKIIGGINQELNTLTANSNKEQCFVQPKLDTMYRVFDLGYEFVDNIGEYSQYAVTTPTVTAPVKEFANSIFNGLYNFGKDLVTNVAQALGQGTASISSFLNNNQSSSAPTPPVTPILSPNLTVEPLQPPITEEIVPAVEELSYQDQLDNIQEKLDIIKQQVQDLIDQQNLELDKEKKKLEENIDKNKDKETTKKNTGATHINYPKILISEAQVSPIGQRFIELYNPNSESISLTGWYLQRKDSNDDSWGSLVSSTSFENKTISANSYFLISREIGGSNIISNITLTNDNSLALKNPNEEISDKLGFGNAIDPEATATINPATGQSIGRKVIADGLEQDTDNNLADFEVDTPTPKAQNIKFVEPPIIIPQPLSIITYTISNQVFSPNGDGIKDTTSIDLEFSEDVKVDFDIINSTDAKVRDFYNSSKVKNPDEKIWDGKDDKGIIVPDGVYKLKIVFTDMAGNSITNTSKVIVVENFIPSSSNFTITPTCLFSSPDVSDAFNNNPWSVVHMCGCTSPASADEIKGYGINMKACGWNFSTNQTCRDVSFSRNGDTKKWTYQTIYIINGFCSLTPTLPNPVPSSDTLVTSAVYKVSVPNKGVATIINLPFEISRAEFLSNLTKNQVGQTWDNSAISDPLISGDKLVVRAEDGISKATYTISVPNSNKFTITPDCTFSSPDVSDAFNNNPWSVVHMCGCTSPASADTIRGAGITMKKNCGWTSSTNQTCYDVSFSRNGDSKKWTYQTVYVINGTCSLLPSITPIDIPEIKGIRPPVIGGTPVTTASESPEYTSAVSWLPDDGYFVANTIYTAKITIIPKTAYSLIGIPENFFTVAGTSFPATNVANSGVIMATFPATAIEETKIPSNNYTITPDCIFSSPDVSTAYGNSWSVVGMCGCSSPNWSDTIRDSGHDMKVCSWNSSTNQTCSEITFGRNGSKNKWVYPAVNIKNGVCSVEPVLPPLSDNATIASSSYTVSALASGAGTIINIPATTLKLEFLANLTKNQAGQTWDDSAISDPVKTGDILLITAEDKITKATYTITINEVVEPASATQLKIISLPQTFLEGAPSAVFTVESQDSSGVLAKVLSTTYVNLSSDSPTGLFSWSSANGPCDEDWTKTSITIAKNTAHKSFCYKDITFGTYSITISANGLSSDSQAVVIDKF